ncbi:DUF2218 domain-containing protein [Tateyamaria sp. ANG-S1]|uniref:DUF2218 domain-containing protein n=1 Tax=Tateyamaria sp. ANG-S1 TaxID=1577905 RepID=UPI00057F161B|nr:DUF2218 domain-containing protein [Tateyamaria sp. ANG-S1]KIC47909.1 hypothetical protein RA29_18575 [Tateyamaria sp. ANG-S1]
MTSLIGTFDTSNGSRYLQQLCKHFGHKVQAEYTDASGFAALGFGDTTFAASETALTVTIALNDGEDPQDAQRMIDAHLARFAFREAFETMSWRVGAQAA